MSYHVEDEIASQPDCWRRAVELSMTISELLPQPGERVAFVGCGTSWFVAQVLASLRETSGQGESDAATPSELLERPYDRVVALTRSGTTTEVVELLSRLQGQVPTVAVTADLNTPVVDVVDEVVDLTFADERSVVQTRFATTTLALFRSWLGRFPDALVDQAQGAVEQTLDPARAAAEQITFLGRGWTIGLAHEAALKLRETSASWAESYPAMDYRHGPISIADNGRLVWMLGPAPKGLKEQVRETGALFVESHLDPMAELIVAQRVAVARAVRLGVDPDQPRHLTRSVLLPG
ncbi:MAG TPA: sugar isomerase [Propionibacteriaceae bacterium]